MRDHVTFIVSSPVQGIPVGNFAGYVDHENRLSIDPKLLFPHVRATPELTQCVLRIEREDHPGHFAASDPYNMRDVDVTTLIRRGVIRYDQNAIPDSLRRQ